MQPVQRHTPHPQERPHSPSAAAAASEGSDNMCNPPQIQLQLHCDLCVDNKRSMLYHSFSTKSRSLMQKCHVWFPKSDSQTPPLPTHSFPSSSVIIAKNDRGVAGPCLGPHSVCHTRQQTALQQVFRKALLTFGWAEGLTFLCVGMYIDA